MNETDDRGEPLLALRVRVDGGGCSGFMYRFSLERLSADDSSEVVKAQFGQKVVVDATSKTFLKGATVDYVTEVIKEAFEITNNPNADAKCGCGVSFDVTSNATTTNR